jgi:hypothetical protein
VNFVEARNFVCEGKLREANEPGREAQVVYPVARQRDNSG